MENKLLAVSSTPHVRGSLTTAKIMRDVLIALLPACIFSVYHYGIKALIIITASVLFAVLTEFLYRKISKKDLTITDGSAAITGVLLAFNLPPEAPLWMVAIGNIFAIVIVKQLFGGLGQNFMNPALAARALLLASFPVEMTNWSTVDTVSAATYLAVMKETSGEFIPQYADYMNLLFSKIGGCIGETSSAALIAGGLYLIFRKVISWRIPVSFIASFAFFSFIFGRSGLFTGNVAFELLSGGLMMGAFFMATDYSTTPVSPNGKIVMGIGCGLMTVLIRVYGGYPEGVSYAILIMNLFVPLIDRYVRPRVYGVVRKA